MAGHARGGQPREDVGPGVRHGIELPTRRSLVLVWTTAAVGLALLLAVADRARGPFDDPDPARQRPGILDLGDLPSPSPEIVAGIPATGRRAVVFFERTAGLEGLCEALRENPLPGDTDVVVVVSADGGSCLTRATVVADPLATYARRFGLDVPRDGGAPVGYAVVDSRQRIRYRTLDPQVAHGLREVATIVAATP